MYYFHFDSAGLLVDWIWADGDMAEVLPQLTDDFAKAWHEDRLYYADQLPYLSQLDSLIPVAHITDKGKIIAGVYYDWKSKLYVHTSYKELLAFAEKEFDSLESAIKSAEGAKNAYNKAIR